MDITKIYLVENCYGDPNKVYIGKSKTKYGRKCNHKKTYGENITYTYIDEIGSLDHKVWKPLEAFWISYFKFLGFIVLNENEGGQGPSFQTEESKLNHSKKMKGRLKPEGFGERHSLKTKGKPRHTKESKDKIREKMKNHPSLSTKNRKDAIGKANSIPVKQLDLDGNLIKLWKSQSEVKRILGLNNISATCNGRQQTAGGFKWSF